MNVQRHGLVGVEISIICQRIGLRCMWLVATVDSTTVADGSYTHYAVAQDTSGNSVNSRVHVTVKNK